MINVIVIYFTKRMKVNIGTACTLKKITLFNGFAVCFFFFFKKYFKRVDGNCCLGHFLVYSI